MSRPRLAVWMYGTHVAQIDLRKGHALRLRFTKQAMERWPINTPVLSCSLPVARSWAPASAFLRGLLPEGQHLQAAASAANVTTADTYGLLVRYGRDVAGAVVITRHDEEPDRGRWGAVPYDEGSLAGALDNLTSDNPIVHDDSELSIPGLQNKMLLVREGGAWARPTGGRPSTHILKIDDPRYPGLVAAEYAALRLGQDIGLTSINPELAHVNGRDCLIVERFDRSIVDGAVQRLHQEDICQALGLDHEANRGRGKYEAAGGPSFQRVAGLLYDYAEDPDAEIARLARCMTFTRMIGNADAHGKNVALLHDETGTTRLAPLYDTVPTVLWPKLRTHPAMSIGSSKDLNSVTLDDLVAEAARWPAPSSLTRSAIDETLDALRSVEVEHEGLASQIDGAFAAL